MRNLIVILGLFCFLFLGVTDTLIAQDGESKLNFYRPRVALKFVPLPLVDYTPAAQMALEIGTFKNQALELEYGYVFDLHKYRNPDANFTGHKFIGTYRFYFFEKEDGPRNLFFGLRYMHKRVNVKGTDYVWKNDGAYQELVELKLQNTTNAGFFMCGYVLPLFKNFWFEGALGVGFRELKIKVVDLPDGIEYNGNITSGNSITAVGGEGDYFFPGLIISAKLTYSLF